MCLQTRLSLVWRLTSRPVLSGRGDEGAAARGHPQSISIWSPWRQVCSFFPISELLEVIRTLKCEELSPCIKLGTSGKCAPPPPPTRYVKKRGFGGGRGCLCPDWLRATLRTLKGRGGQRGGLFHYVRPGGQEVGRKGGSSSLGAPCSPGTNLGCYRPKHGGRGVFNVVSIYQVSYFLLTNFNRAPKIVVHKGKNARN